MMKKLFINGVIFFLLIMVGVYAALTGSALNTPSGDLGTSVTVNFNLANTEVYDITNVNFTAYDLTGPSSYTIGAPSISDLTTTITSGNSVNSSFNVAIPSGSNSVLAGTYNGNVDFTGSNGSSSVSGQFSYNVVVNSINGLSVDTYSLSSPLVLTAQEETSDSDIVIVRNTGSTQLSGITINHDIETGDDDGDNVTITITPQNFSLSPGNSQSVTFTASMEENLDVGTYDGDVSINDTSGVSTSFHLDAKVTPEICEDGVIGELDIDMDEPDDGDDFDFGETINIELDVRNHYDKDMDVVVEAFLYNIDEDEELVRVESDSTEIKDGDEETFKLDLEIPSDNDFDEDDEYILYIKAYEDGDEDDHCDQSDIDIDLDRQSNEVIIDGITINPNSISCGETVNIDVDVENVGTKDEDDVVIRLLNSVLGLDIKSDKFDLESFDDSDNDATKAFTYVVPRDLSAGAGAYSIEAIVTFKNGKETNSDFETLTIVNCGEVSTEETITTPVTQETLKATEGAESTTSSEFVPVNFWKQIQSGLSKPSTIFWIIADLLLIIVVIFFIKMLFSKRK